MIDVSMLESMLSLTLSEIQIGAVSGDAAGQADLRPDRDQATATSTCRSPASARSRTWPPRAAGRDWITDPRFAKYPDRRANWGALIDELEVWSRQRATAPRCRRSSTGTACRPRPIARSSEALTDPQLEHRGALRRGARCGRQLPRAEPAVSFFGDAGRGAALCRRAR